MSVEKAIREKHAFRERLKDFLSIAVVMTKDEIEIGLGRLVDLLNEAEDETEKRNTEIKGAVLNWYFDLRESGIVRQNAKRRKDIPDLKEEVAREMHKRAMDEWKTEGHLERWRQKQSQQPFWKRLFSAPPSPPYFWSIYNSIDGTQLEEYYLNQIVSFPLVPRDSLDPDVAPEDVKALVT